MDVKTDRKCEECSWNHYATLAGSFEPMYASIGRVCADLRAKNTELLPKGYVRLRRDDGISVKSERVEHDESFGTLHSRLSWVPLRKGRQKFRHIT